MERWLKNVNCYSGRTCNERPESFLWDNRRLKVISIEKEWWEPGARCFYIRTDDDKLFKLCYYETTDQWLVTA